MLIFILIQIIISSSYSQCEKVIFCHFMFLVQNMHTIQIVDVLKFINEKRGPPIYYVRNSMSRGGSQGNFPRPGSQEGPRKVLLIQKN